VTARYYFAAAYQRRAEIETYANQLIIAGVGYVTSRWIEGGQADDDNDAGFSAAGLTDDRSVGLAWEYARRDFADIARSDVIVSFTGPGTRGGRHVEFGIGLDMLMSSGWNDSFPTPRLVIVGPREHVFHCHPKIHVHADFAAFLQYETERMKTQ
jgi:hypothetical protein